MNSLKNQINEMVSSLRDSLQRNTQAREAAELANKSKSEFLANSGSLLFNQALHIFVEPPYLFQCPMKSERL